MALERAPKAYELFRQERDGAIKIVLAPDGA
jgi:threonine dehydrogenase-like Zn-dependent dehydrogenase